MSDNLKIAIIGAGPSGITALKNLATNGLDVTCFEMNDQIGGNWVYKDKTGHSSVFKTTFPVKPSVTNTSTFLVAKSLPSTLPIKFKLLEDKSL